MFGLRLSVDLNRRPGDAAAGVDQPVQSWIAEFPRKKLVQDAQGSVRIVESCIPNLMRCADADAIALQHLNGKLFGVVPNVADTGRVLTAPDTISFAADFKLSNPTEARHKSRVRGRITDALTGFYADLANATPCRAAERMLKPACDCVMQRLSRGRVPHPVKIFRQRHRAIPQHLVVLRICVR